MSTENVKLAMELDRQLMAALARMDEVAAGALMADGLVWTHVNARVNDNKESVFKPRHSGDLYRKLTLLDQLRLRRIT